LILSWNLIEKLQKMILFVFSISQQKMPLTIEREILDEILSKRDKMYRVAKRMLISGDEAEDATQEVIVKLWQMPLAKLKTFRSIEAYSMTMLKNYCLDRLKSKQAARSSIEDDGNVFSKQSSSLSNVIDHKDALDWVSKIVSNLPHQERMIVQLRDIEQYDFEEIAAILSIPEGTVRVYLSRARKKIRHSFMKIDSHGISRN